MNKVELLAPAGDLQKLKFALTYGADAVYIGGQIFGLRSSAKNFTFDEMSQGIAFAHNLDKKVYLVLNIIPHNDDFKLLDEYLNEIKKLDIDALILSDPGTLMYVKEYLPEKEIHLSTQANNTNYLSAKFWHNQGIKRVIIARELSFNEIKEIRDNTPDSLEIEAFVHGAMCISYSGRCLLSNYMTGRDANKGECAQACRWKYKLVEEKRPDEYYPVVEDESGTFFFNSKDLCMIEHIPDLIESGLSSLKIEGRMKSLYYVANIIRVYREAIDKYYKSKEKFKYDQNWLDEIKKASHRKFTTGFYLKKPDENDQLYSSSSYIREYDFCGIVKDYDVNSKYALVEQRNRMFIGDKIEIIGPNYFYHEQLITEMYDKNDKPIEVAPHAQEIIKIKIDVPVNEFYILRKEKVENVGK
ncbi:peptidase U32 family protein [Helicovermis profundi]|uniref:U32 family peptidase n=1 Tax=Helicovermis profundi TaxID=3065157 RepID=A0AAU9E8E3_9FIRM|nr:U32 family peptidase [Clostridia bacterium S502]